MRFLVMLLILGLTACSKEPESTASSQNKPNTVPSPFHPQIKDDNYKSLDVDANTFINRFNSVVLQVNQNWALTTANHTSKKQGDKYFGIKFSPTSGTSIGGTVNDDGTIRELLLVIGSGTDDEDNLRSITTMLGVSIAINHQEVKETVSKIVTGLFKDAMSHPRKASEATIGKYDYTVNYSPELGGMLFAISDAKAGID